MSQLAHKCPVTWYIVDYYDTKLRNEDKLSSIVDYHDTKLRNEDKRLQEF